MMTLGPTPYERKSRRNFPVAAEWVLAFGVLCGLMYVLQYYLLYGYLPQPFFFDLTDPLMDLYNVAYWSHHRGTYSVWHAVYPPISFVLTRLISNSKCYEYDAHWGRDCDPLARWVLYSFFVLNLYLLYRCFRRNRSTAIPRTIALGLGLPMLFGLDRGNLLIFCFTTFMLSFGNGFGSTFSKVRSRVLMLALAINFKPYLLVTVFPRAAARHIRWLWAFGICVLAIYAATYFLEGGGSPFEIIQGAKAFTATYEVENFWEKSYYSTSFAPLLRFASSDFPLLQYLGSGMLDGLVLVFTSAIKLGVVACIIVYGLALLRPSRVSPRRLAAMTLCLVMTLTESNGGYAQVFPLFLIFSEQWEGLASLPLLGSAYLLCLPLDYTILQALQGSAQGWWSGREVYNEFGVTLGQFARPMLMMIILYSLAWFNARRLLRKPAADAFRAPLQLKPVDVH